jgi:hypothetical protein
MAFALGTTAGAGTITIATGGTVVTGVGTNFQTANIGAIIVVGSQWGIIATRTSTTSITIDRPFLTAVTASAYQISANIPVITQTGTDTSLTGLSGVAGVTTSLNLWTITSAVLQINGTLDISRTTNRLRFLNTASVVTLSTTVTAMTVGATGVFDNSVNQTLNGYSFKSPSYSILFDVTIPNYSTPHSTASLIYGVLGSTITIEGDIELTNTTANTITMIGSAGTMTLQNGSIINAVTIGSNYNFFAIGASAIINLINWAGYGVSLRVGENTTNINNYAGIAGPYVININTGTTINNAIYTGLQDLGNTVSFRFIAGRKYIQFVNFSSSRLVPTLSNANTLGGSQYLIVNQLRLTATGAIGNIPDVKFWARDSNNGLRYTQNYGAGQAYEIATTGDLTYTATTNASGVAPTQNIISVVYYEPTGTTSVIDYRGNNGAQDLNIYQCAYNYVLSNSLTNLYPLNNGIYGGVSVRNQGFVLLTDTSITEPIMANVATYTTINNNAELYDFAKYYLYTNFAGQTATYITGTGDAGSYNVIINQLAINVFTPTPSSLAIKSANFSGDLKTFGSVILANGSIISNNNIDAPNILQDIPTNLNGVTTTGNLTFNTNTPITVTFTDCDIQGTISNTGNAIVNIVKVNTTIGIVGNNVIAEQFATITAPNLLSGTRVRVYDEDNGVEMFNGVLSSAGFNETFVYEYDKTVTLTATYTNGVTAKLGISATGIFTANGVSFLVSQEDDLVYNSYGINGSTVTGFTADYVQADVNLTVTTNFTASNLYAWWIYTLTSEEGIREFFGGITALDSANIRINSNILNLFLDNSTALFIYQTDNIRLFRSDNAYPAKVTTTGGGGIQVNWNSNVYVGTADIQEQLGKTLKLTEFIALK